MSIDELARTQMGRIPQDLTERRRVEEALTARIREQTALYRFTDRLQRAESLEDVYEPALDAILDALQCSRASILLRDDSGMMRFVASRGLSESYRRAVDGHSPWGPGVKDAEPICVDDVGHAAFPETLKRVVIEEGIHALSFIPLQPAGRLIGKLMAYYDVPHAFMPAEVDLAVTIARQLGFGIERKRAEQAAHRLAAVVEQAETQQRVLLNELNHRVKNNMQMLQSLLEAAARRARSSEAREVLEEASGRITAMAAAQRVLYTTPDATRCNARDFLNTVCETAKQTFPREVDIDCEADAVQLSNDAAMPLALIANELLTNAVKHGLNGRRAGTIRVRLTRENESFLFYVEDDGPGFHLQSAQRRSSGLALVQGLARQLRGEFEVTRTPATRCSLRFQ
jgi:two-component sensor histidine kinase